MKKKRFWRANFNDGNGMKKIGLHNRKKGLIIGLLALSSLINLSLTNQGKGQNDRISIVPYPAHVAQLDGNYILPEGPLVVSMPSQLKEMYPIMQHDYHVLTGKKLTGKKLALNKGKSTMTIEVVPDYPAEYYELSIQAGIKIKAGSYESVLMAWTSFMQLIQQSNDVSSVPRCIIKDSPDLTYRGLLLDLGRKFQSIASIKNIVETCRWYKINYLQLHLNDDDLFVFPSDAYPKLATVGKSYTKKELRDLVEYARLRGVSIVPEFDAPAHTGSLRKAYPELFGPFNLKMIDLGNPAVLSACKTIVGEMIEIFNTSPYFHIGADEVKLDRFSQLETTKKAVIDKGYDNAYDLYLNYIVEMHQFVKSRGVKTLAWEGFENDGSEKVEVPKDIIVFAWESFYQRPDSLLQNGYTIINASWKPIYITPTKRWRQTDIYHWNSWRWENFNKKAPSYHAIQLKGTDKDNVLGAQMCAWEMTEEMNLPAILSRLPAISERVWNVGSQDYAFFKRRYERTDEKLNRLIFPAEIVKEGLTDGLVHERFYNRENYFPDRLIIRVRPLFPAVTVRYTTDGSVPDIRSPLLTDFLEIDATTTLRLSLFKGSRLIGYKSELLERRPIELLFTGNTQDVENPVDGIERFKTAITVSAKRINTKLVPRYTTDGSSPTRNSQEFDHPLRFTKDTNLKVQCFSGEGKPEGSVYRMRLQKETNE